MNQSTTFIHVLNQWIAVFMHRSMQNLNKFTKESGYSMSQIFALTFIHHHGTCGVSDLGEGLGVSNAAASQMLDKLVQQGMIARTEDPADRRGKQISLTAKGTNIVQESFFARQSWFRELEDSLTEQEIEQAVAVLNFLSEKGKQMGTSREPDHNPHPTLQ